MNRDPLDRAAIVLGTSGIVSLLFALTTSSNNNFVLVHGLGLVVFPALGVVAIAGGILGARTFVLVAGVGYMLAAVLQLVQFGQSTNWLGGNGSTFALLLAYGVGLVVVGVAQGMQASSVGDRSQTTSPGTSLKGR